MSQVLAVFDIEQRTWSFDVTKDNSPYIIDTFVGFSSSSLPIDLRQKSFTVEIGERIEIWPPENVLFESTDQKYVSVYRFDPYDQHSELFSPLDPLDGTRETPIILTFTYSDPDGDVSSTLNVSIPRPVNPAHESVEGPETIFDEMETDQS